ESAVDLFLLYVNVLIPVVHHPESFSYWMALKSILQINNNLSGQRSFRLHILNSCSFSHLKQDYCLSKLGLCNQCSFLKLIENANFPSKDARLSIRSLHIAGIPVRFYQPKASQDTQRGVLFIHGGAGTLGSLVSYERLCRHISRETDSVVWSIGYSLAPEQSYPVQFQQCFDVAVHFLKHAEDYGVDPNRIIISGDSFGGLLAASVCQMISQRNDIPRLRAQVLIYPFLQSVNYSLPSYRQNAHVPPLTQRHTVKFALQYLQKNVSLEQAILDGAHVPREIKMKYRNLINPDNIPKEFKVRKVKAPKPRPSFGEIRDIIEQLCGPLLSPLLVEDESIQQLPETFLLTCQYDVLRDDAILYKKRLEDNGVAVSWCHLEDGFHGFFFLINHWLLTFSCCRTGMDTVLNYLRRL
uniref:Alpha/beta hydrolase fold-3 domain-containing protein n=1 Tax=Varanus komodoensis TaxID=61221 RepID=A0A8D2LM42_VARKO